METGIVTWPLLVTLAAHDRFGNRFGTGRHGTPYISEYTPYFFRYRKIDQLPAVIKRPDDGGGAGHGEQGFRRR